MEASYALCHDSPVVPSQSAALTKKNGIPATLAMLSRLIATLFVFTPTTELTVMAYCIKRNHAAYIAHARKNDEIARCSVRARRKKLPRQARLMLRLKPRNPPGLRGSAFPERYRF
jgi:hypothetical protein